MKIITLVSLLAFMNIIGCGSSDGDDGCDFDFDSFLNGPNAQQSDSLWNCINNVDQITEFQAFEDGTGFISGTVVLGDGPFTYQQTGCRSARLQTSGGTSFIMDLRGSTQSGILTFTQENVDGGIFSVACELEVFLPF